MSNLKQAVLKIAKVNPEFAQALVQELRTATSSLPPRNPKTGKPFSSEAKKLFLRLKTEKSGVSGDDPAIINAGNELVDAGVATISGAGDRIRLKKAAKKPETPVQQAVWAAWQLFEGGTRNDYLSLVGSAADDATVSEIGDQDIRVFNLGNKIDKALKSAVAQSKSWRSAYNMSLEGRIQLDTDRLARDLMQTIINIRKISQLLTALKKLVGGKDEFLEDSLQKAMEVAIKTERAFEKAAQLAIKS